MTEQATEAAPDVTVDGPATTDLLTEASLATETQASQEQTETVDATDGDPQGEQAGAPESYEFVAPEGITVDNASAPIAAYSELAKSLGLTQDKAQEGYAKLVAAQAEHSKAQFDGLVKQWQDETRNDPVVGGEHLQANLVKANQVLATIDGGEEAKALLTQSGLVNNKAVIRLLAGFRDAIGDDHFVAGNDQETPRERTAKDFFGLAELK